MSDQDKDQARTTDKSEKVVTVKLPKARCGKCGKTWTIRVEQPTKCPKCFSTDVKVLAA